MKRSSLLHCETSDTADVEFENGAVGKDIQAVEDGVTPILTSVRINSARYPRYNVGPAAYEIKCNKDVADMMLRCGDDVEECKKTRSGCKSHYALTIASAHLRRASNHQSYCPAFGSEGSFRRK